MGSMAAAEQIRYAVGAPPTAPQINSIEKYAAAIEDHTDGELDLKIYALSLLSFAEMSDGIRDGMADAGWVLTPYHSREYPHTNFVSESSMMLEPFSGESSGKEGWAFGGALTEYILTDCPKCLEEFSEQNQVPTALVGGTWYGLICTSPVKSMADLEGTRIRTGAANQARWAEAVNAVPVQMSANEMHEALNSGVVDCSALAVSDIQNYGVEESVTDLTPSVPGGLFPSSVFQYNRDKWSSFTTAQREALLRAAAAGSAAIMIQYRKDLLKAQDLMEELGASFHEADDEVLAATGAFIEKDMKAATKTYAEDYGNENGEQILGDFRELLIKWRGLVEDVESEEALADLLWTEILSEVDPETYGVK
jgi:TRAP-type C4-dicarboxylate transport system substrate-binding protein